MDEQDRAEQQAEQSFQLSTRHTRWRIGYEKFSRLDGSSVRKWYVFGAGYKQHWGGFDSEAQAIEYLLEVVRQKENQTC